MTDNSPERVDLNALLPADTITEPADLVGLTLGMTTDGHLLGSLLVATKDGWHRYLLGRENWTEILAQAAEFTDMFNDRDKLTAAIAKLQAGQADDDGATQ